jgi:hypothetical protein
LYIEQSQCALTPYCIIYQIYCSEASLGLTEFIEHLDFQSSFES